MSEAQTSCPVVILRTYQKLTGRFSDRFYGLELSAQKEKLTFRKKAVKTTVVGTGTKAEASIQMPKRYQVPLPHKPLVLTSISAPTEVYSSRYRLNTWT